MAIYINGSQLPITGNITCSLYPGYQIDFCNINGVQVWKKYYGYEYGSAENPYWMVSYWLDKDNPESNNNVDDYFTIVSNYRIPDKTNKLEVWGGSFMDL